MGDERKENNAESSFFEELVKQDFYQDSTKTASYEGGMSKDAAKSMLDSFSADQLESLAEEFDSILGKQASDENTLENTLEYTILEDDEKLAEDSEDDIVKEAADRALELLAEKDLGLEDYAYSRLGDEKIASIVAEKGEKLSVIMDRNPLLVIDDIVSSLEEKISTYEE